MSWPQFRVLYRECLFRLIDLELRDVRTQLRFFAFGLFSHLLNGSG